MTVDCRDCRWNREEPTAIEILRGLDLALVESFAYVLQEVESWLENEKQKELDKVRRVNDDALSRGDTDALRSAVWAAKPGASAYCGRDSRVAGMRELINLFGDCPTYFPGKKVYRSCNTCRHLHRPDIPQFSAGAGLESEEAFLRTARGMIENSVKQEVLQAVKQQGEITSRPIHLPTCQLYSRTNVFVVGPLINSRHDCAGWEAATGD